MSNLNAMDLRADLSLADIVSVADSNALRLKPAQPRLACLADTPQVHLINAAQRTVSQVGLAAAGEGTDGITRIRAR